MVQPYAIVGATIIDGTGGDPVPDGCLVVHPDGTLGDVGERSRIQPPTDVRTLDAGGAVVMPGIIDCHCHLGGASLPDEDGWALEDDRFQAIASVHQAGRLLRHGVTSARDISVNGPQLKKAIRQGLIDGPQLVPCWRGLSRTGGHGDGLVISAEAVRRCPPVGHRRRWSRPGPVGCSRGGQERRRVHQGLGQWRWPAGQRAGGRTALHA